MNDIQPMVIDLENDLSLLLVLKKPRGRDILLLPMRSTHMQLHALLTLIDSTRCQAISNQF